MKGKEMPYHVGQVVSLRIQRQKLYRCQVFLKLVARRAEPDWWECSDGYYRHISKFKPLTKKEKE
jgi:hypothetical protein